MKFKYALYINDVLIDKFFRIKDIDIFLESYSGYIDKLEIKKI